MPPGAVAVRIGWRVNKQIVETFAAEKAGQAAGRKGGRQGRGRNWKGKRYRIMPGSGTVNVDTASHARLAVKPGGNGFNLSSISVST